jgi:hypothetical protein
VLGMRGALAPAYGGGADGKMTKGLIIEIRDAHGNVVKRMGPDYNEPSKPPSRPVVKATTTTMAAAREGITFHQQPCGAYAGARRVFGTSEELVAGVMLSWLTWERRGRPT